MIHYLLERLAVGAAEDARRAPERVSAILNCAEEVELSTEPGIYHTFPLKEFSAIEPEIMSEAIQWIATHIPHHTILLICNAGMQRSPSIAVAYLCSIGFGYDEAVRFVAAKKPDFTPVPDLCNSIEECLNFYL